ncbi:MAG: gamma-glutamylcyclotransferase family protein [Erythrobacter sp.]
MKSTRHLFALVLAGAAVLLGGVALAAGLGVSAEWIAAFGNLMMAAGTVTAAFWAVYSFRQSKRAEAARWVKELFGEFFFNSNFDEVRDLIEFGYERQLKPVLLAMLLGRALPDFSAEERRLLRELDNFLNYLEYVLYLESMGHIETDDREAIFNYWTGVLADDDHALVRLYCRQYGYERVAALVNRPDQPAEPLLAVYGTLRSGVATLEPLGMRGRMIHRGPCTIAGQLLDLGQYPGLIVGDDGAYGGSGGVAFGGRVKGDLFAIPDPAIWRELDTYEEFFPEDLAASEYDRIYCRLLDPPLDAWVYRYIGPVDEARAVPGGDWLERGD